MSSITEDSNHIIKGTKKFTPLTPYPSNSLNGCQCVDPPRRLDSVRPRRPGQIFVIQRVEVLKTETRYKRTVINVVKKSNGVKCENEFTCETFWCRIYF